jgi:hypothetical protein
VDAAAERGRRFAQPFEILQAIVDAEEHGATVVAALDQMLRLIRQEIAAEPGYRCLAKVVGSEGSSSDSAVCEKSYSDPDFSLALRRPSIVSLEFECPLGRSTTIL